MTLAIGNESNITFTYTLGTNQALNLDYNANALPSYGNKVFVELLAPPTPPTTTILIKNTSGAAVHAWTATPTGMVPWNREGAMCSAPFSNVDSDVLVVHVPNTVTVPTPTSSSGPPAPGTSQTVLRVKVKNQGSLPL